MKKQGIIVMTGVFLVTGISILALGLIKANREGNTKNAELVIGSSAIYREEEIQAAMDVVLKEFRNFPATLNKLWYDEEKSKGAGEEWAEVYHGDEAIVLYSNFKTYKGQRAFNDGFDSDFEYQNWTWILVRTNHGEWQLKNWGY